jgi:hypothetical protein
VEEKMMKKILKWSIYAAVVGALVFGAVTRTSARINQEPLAEQRSLSDGGGYQGGSGHGQGGSGEGHGDFGLYQDQADEEKAKGQATQDGGSRLYPQADAEEHAWTTIVGEVVSVSDLELQFAGDEGEVITIDGRAWRLALEEGFSPAAGDQLELAGFYEDGEFEAAEIHDLSSGQQMLLRDTSGRPLWSGGSNR